MNYFDWVLENSSWIASVYPKFEIRTMKPKVILIAPDFTDSVIIGAKYFNTYADITLYKYSIVAFKDGKDVICSEFKIPEIYEVPEKPRTREDEINYIKDEKVREVFTKTIEAIEHIGSDVEPSVTQSRIVFKYQGRNFASLNSRRSSFYIEWKEESGWNEERVSELEKAQRIIEERVRQAYGLVGGKLTEKASV